MKMMQLSYLPLLLVLFSTTTSDSEPAAYSDCAPAPYVCGEAAFTIGYPFRIDGRHDSCGYPNFYLSCTSNDTLTITISNKNFQVTYIDYDNRLLYLVDPAFVRPQSCPQPHNTTVDPNLFRVSDRNTNLTLFINCTASAYPSTYYDLMCVSFGWTGQHSYYRLDNGTTSTNGDDASGMGCSSTVVVPMAQDAAARLANRELDFGAALQQGFSVNWLPGMDWCGSKCVGSGGTCGYNASSPGDHTCFCPNGTFIDSCPSSNTWPTGKKSSRSWIVILGALASVTGFVLVCGLCLLCYKRRYKQRLYSSTLIGPNSSVGTPSSKKNVVESTSFHCHTHLFSYEELAEATRGFDPSQEIGDGGYGSVYKGVLRDGRTVAVKRLYKTSYKRVEQFVNEVEILSGLRHPNLVTLYGCTSPRSPTLLLVYEFVPNGTLADHLHDPLRSRSLPLPVRLSMAVDAASALSYLHSMDIIHRDVKTHNILVDQHYRVKVADFGLSRLFPADATHVSTAPQGTPGYLDPEYHRFYQLTDKSDVYSYGVVLMELLSSRPAVDVGKQPNEISLAMMAVNKIQKGELDFVDPALLTGSRGQAEEAHGAVVAQVAELAFRCLQMDREMRPSIKEVLEELREVSRVLRSSGGEEAAGEFKAAARDDLRLLKDSTAPFSPNSVTHEWTSRSTTPNASK
ncbi:LEAF RUST 10 DISEASE-RESISTANCE LOCUS RECEPTOR-LIKE PROTEIN KINASE-like 1.2 [Iris pallida]|uniref:LEAF RUST 10 DISEASE-RESISTANCE LOCUS RECEPTOR-LIKE PROTEIN KINASE-like 1.2 n=1 Tax=Iris pallida TaxID=29817 RepID=A0AAX6HFT2_IRIPA|nr:LEAF RUST 10 DISEASE-RESISTANCE LOCUS RECEPTOR-LIKE PROTEIN KINASE-like 1.2 [Iris pallida]